MFFTFLSVFTAKCLHFLLRLCRRGGTTLPGRAALWVKYNVLTVLSKNVNIVCVTGTNGKTTTCALLAHALEQAGCSYFINRSGANMLSGVTTAFCDNSTVFGRCKKEYAVLECDENSFPLLARYLDASVVAVTNLFRDQLDRYGEVSHTLSSIQQGITQMPEAVLVLNADCPLTFSLQRQPCLTFGVEACEGGGAPSDSRYCPQCRALLLYHRRVFAALGDFYCPRCGYRRVQPDVGASHLNDSGGRCAFLLEVRGSVTPAACSPGGVYNVYNYCCAAAVLTALGFRDTAALTAFTGAFGRTERFKNGKSEILLFLVKNPVGLANCLRVAAKHKDSADFVFLLNDNDADGRDVSWIWDADFLPLVSAEGAVFALGTRSYDMALRLKYAGIPCTVMQNDGALLRYLKHTKRDTVILATYTAMMRLRKQLIARCGGKEFWQ